MFGLFNMIYVVIFDRKRPLLLLAKSRKEAREKGTEAVNGKYKHWKHVQDCEITSIQPFIIDYFFHNRFVDEN